MEITQPEAGKLKIILTKEEITARLIAPQRWLRDILDTAKLEIGFAPQNARLLVELCRNRQGGILWVTVLAPTTGPVVLGFATAGLLYEAAGRVFARCRRRIGASALYYGAKWTQGYQLVLYPLDYYDSFSIAWLEEYGRITGRGSLWVAYIEEHGHPLIPHQAVDRLAEALG